MKASKPLVLAVLIACVVAADSATVAFRATDAGAPSLVQPEAGRTHARNAKKTESKAAGKAAAARKDGATSSGVAPSRAPEQASGVLPPATGVYQYAAKITTQNDDAEPTTKTERDTYAFHAPTRSGDAWIQSVKIQTSKSTLTRTNRWEPRAVYRIKDSSQNGSCTYDPPQLVLRFPLQVGERWSAGDKHCKEPESLPAGFTSSSSETDRVLRAETIRVGSRTVACYVIEVKTVSAFSSDGAGSGRSESTSLEWFSPETRLFVRVESHGSSTFEGKTPGTGGHSTFSTTATILSLTPK